MAGAAQGCAFEESVESLAAHGEHFLRGEGERGSGRAEQSDGFAFVGVAVVGAYPQTYVAAEERMPASRSAHGLGADSVPVVPVLDGEIAEAAAAVGRAVRLQRTGRTRLQTSSAIFA